MEGAYSGFIPILIYSNHTENNSPTSGEILLQDGTEILLQDGETILLE